MLIQKNSQAQIILNELRNYKDTIQVSPGLFSSSNTALEWGIIPTIPGNWISGDTPVSYTHLGVPVWIV